MNVHNFQLSNVFQNNAKEYVTRPVKAAKYQPGMENSWMVYFEGKSENGEKVRSYFGVKFFPTKDKAQFFIDAHEKQYAMEDGVLVGMEVKCDTPLPVLCREESNIENNNGIMFQFKNKFVSDESEDYEFYILDSYWCDSDIWIIQDMISGNIRVWDRTMDELFFGKETEYVYEKTNKGKYIPVVV